ALRTLGLRAYLTNGTGAEAKPDVPPGRLPSHSPWRTARARPTLTPSRRLTTGRTSHEARNHPCRPVVRPGPAVPPARRRRSEEGRKEGVGKGLGATVQRQGPDRLEDAPQRQGPLVGQG